MLVQTVSEGIHAAGTTTLYQRNPAEAAVCKIHMFEAVPTTTIEFTCQSLI